MIWIQIKLDRNLDKRLQIAIGILIADRYRSMGNRSKLYNSARSCSKWSPLLSPENRRRASCDSSQIILTFFLLYVVGNFRDKVFIAKY